MAFSMSFTDQYGVVAPSSYWRCVQANLCKEEGTGNLVFYGYTDAAQKGQRIIGQKSYSLSGAAYAAFNSALSAITGASGLPRPIESLQDAIMAQAYIYATATQDVVATPAEGGTPAVMKSFFSGATVV